VSQFTGTLENLRLGGTTNAAVKDARPRSANPVAVVHAARIHVFASGDPRATGGQDQPQVDHVLVGFRCVSECWTSKVDAGRVDPSNVQAGHAN
jgi:hypothetical protein